MADPCPPALAASQCHEVSRFTCRASPSAPGQWPGLPSPPCPELPLGLLALSPERQRGTISLSHTACAHDCLYLFLQFAGLLIRPRVCCTHTLVRNTIKKWSCRGDRSAGVWKFPLLTPPSQVIWRARVGQAGRGGAHGISGSRAIETAQGPGTAGQARMPTPTLLRALAQLGPRLQVFGPHAR